MSIIQQVRGAETGLPIRHLIRELISFGLVGGIGTMITFAGANLLVHRFGDSPVTSAVIPMLAAAAASYALNRRFTFRHRDSAGSHREMLIFFGLNGVGIVIQTVSMGLRTYTLGLHDAVSFNVAMAIGMMIGGIFRYWSYRRWIFLTMYA